MSGDDERLPLAVDLDGTLVATDALWESLLLLARNSPADLLALPLWCLRGKAYFKRRLAERVLPDVTLFPYRTEVIAHIETARAKGARVLLVTASDQAIADAVSRHLGLFDEALGSNGVRNLSGVAKRDLLEGRYGRQGFAYVGDSTADVPVWRAAGQAFVVGGAAARARLADRPVVEIGASSSGLAAAARALRPHQWVKNLLLFVAPGLAFRLGEPATFLHACAGAVAFSLAASSVYVLNDLFDLEADRQHTRKRRRPLAAGQLGIPAGLLLSALTLAGALVSSRLVLPDAFTASLLGYIAANLAYSLYLKKKLIVDVVVLALLFTYRVLAGGLAVDVPVSFWLLAFSFFFFTGLAFAKRYSDLVRHVAEGREGIAGRGYTSADLSAMLSVGSACGLVAVMVFALYIHSLEVHALYQRPQALWLICPVLLYWFTRVWFLAARNELDDDPVVFALRDRTSYVAGLVAAACVVVARW